MTRKSTSLQLWVVMALFVLVAIPIAGEAGSSTGNGFEVWALDQSDTSSGGGGRLYIWKGADLSQDASKAKPEIIDLAEAAKAANCSIARRPHMILPNHTTPPSHVIISNVGSGDIHFLDVKTRKIAGCVQGAGTAHAAAATLDNRIVLVADTAGERLHKIQTDYTTNTYTLVETLLVGTDKVKTPLGTDAVKPICHEFTTDSQFAYVTLAGGGLLVVAVGTADGSTPMRVAHVYPKDKVPGIGCGAFRMPDGSMITNGESGAKGGDDFLYIFDTSKVSSGVFPDPVQIELPGEDTHGVSLCTDEQGKLFALTAMRVSNEINIIDLQTHQVVKTLSMVRPFSPDPKPDLTDIREGKLFVALRGPKPLTAIGALENPQRTPGVAVLSVDKTCQSFEWEAKDLASMSDKSRTIALKNGAQATASDPHGLVVVAR